MKYIKKIRDFIKESLSNKELEERYKQDIKRDFGEDSEYWIDTFSSKENRHKKDTYYHVNTKNEKPYSGVGNGFYLGKDPISLLNFYDIEDNGYTISEYLLKGVKWLDLTIKEDFENFKEILGNIINSDEVSEYVKGLGYDGIRYYDYSATGEEFVLFNMGLLNKVSEKTKEEL